MTLPPVYGCIGDVDGSGNGDSSLQVGVTTTMTTTVTTTSTTCQWTLKPCGQCMATPVEYCPANPATDDAMLGPVSGISSDALDTSRLIRRLSKKGCVAAASLYPEIAVCRDEKCSQLDYAGIVETGKRIRILLKITNHCVNKADKDKRALLKNQTLEDLKNVDFLFHASKYISADYAKLDNVRREEAYFEKRR